MSQGQGNKADGGTARWAEEAAENVVQHLRRRFWLQLAWAVPAIACAFATPGLLALGTLRLCGHPLDLIPSAIVVVAVGLASTLIYFVIAARSWNRAIIEICRRGHENRMRAFDDDLSRKMARGGKLTIDDFLPEAGWMYGGHDPDNDQPESGVDSD